MQLQNRKQQKQREREEQRKKDSVGSCDGEEEGSRKIATAGEKESGSDNLYGKHEGEGKESQTSLMVGKDSTMFKSHRSLQFPRNDVRTIKSPTVKITRISSHKRQPLQSGKTMKSTGKQRMAVQIRTSKSSASATSSESIQHTATAKQGNERGASRTPERGVATSGVKNRTTGTLSTKDIPRNEIQKGNDSAVNFKVEGDSSTTMECPPSVSSPLSPTFAGNKGVWPSPVRRSPRLKSKMADTKREGTSHKGDAGRKKGDTEKRREKSLKAVSDQSQCTCTMSCRRNCENKDTTHYIPSMLRSCSSILVINGPILFN